MTTNTGSIKHLLSVVIATLAIILMLLSPQGISAQVMQAAGLTLLVIGFWAIGTWPIGVTGLAFFFIATIIRIQPVEVIFSGFATSALWLVYGGLIIGVSVNHTRLGSRIARTMVTRFGHSYFAVISGIAIVCMILGFLMPSSMGRVVLLVPIVLALADRLGFAPGSRGRTGMVLSTALITFTSAGTILPSLVPGIALAGLAENLYGIHLTYGEYLTWNLPVLGLVRAGLIVLVTVWMFGETPARAGEVDEHRPMSREEWILTGILAVSLLLWVTDFVHGISAAWVALGAAVLILVPGLNLAPEKALNERVDYNTLIYTAAVLGLSVIVANTGLAALIGSWLLQLFPFREGADLANYSFLSLISTIIPMLTTNPGVPAVLSPLAQDFADATGLSLKFVLMTQVIGFTNVVLPYQASPIIVAIAMGGIRLADGARLTLVITLLGALVLVPLNYLWWLLIGVI